MISPIINVKVYYRLPNRIRKPTLFIDSEIRLGNPESDINSLLTTFLEKRLEGICLEALGELPTGELFPEMPNSKNVQKGFRPNLILR